MVDAVGIGGRNAQPQQPCLLLSAQPADPPLGGGVAGRKRLEQLGQDGSALRQGNAVFGACKDLGPELLFQLGNGAGDHGAGNKQRLRRSGDIPLGTDRLEILDLLQRHIRTRPFARPARVLIPPRPRTCGPR